MSLVERTLYDVIDAGLTWFKADPARYERFLLDNTPITAAEAARARLYFGGGVDPADSSVTVKARPPALVHGFARTGGPFPCFALTLGSEDVTQDYLGKDAPLLDSDGEAWYDTESGAIVDPKVRRFRYVFNILVHAEHPDICIQYYSLLKFIVMSSQDVLEERDVEDMTLSGRDMAPDPRFLPDFVFSRMLTITVDGEETWAEAFTQGFATGIRGILLNDDTRRDDDPDYQVTTYVEGQ